MNSVNFKYFQIITKKTILTGLYSIYTDAINLYNKSNSFNKPNFNIILKKFLNGIMILNEDSYNIEINKICTNNNISLEVYQTIFYNILLDNIKSFSSNEKFIKSISTQIKTVKLTDFIRYCYVDISTYLLNNELYDILNVKENKQIDNYILSHQIDQIIITSLYKVLNLESIINYSKQFIEDENKKSDNDILLENITQQINKLSLDIKNIQDDLHNEIQNIKLTKDIQEQIPVNIPTIDIPINNPSKYSINNTVSKSPINIEENKEIEQINNNNNIPDIINKDDIKQEINNTPDLINNEEQNDKLTDKQENIQDDKQDNKTNDKQTTDMLKNILQVENNSIDINGGGQNSVTDLDDFLNEL